MNFSCICCIHCDNEGDDIALEKALKLASQTGAKLDLISVAEEVPATLLERLVTLGTEPEDLSCEFHAAGFFRSPRSPTDSPLR